MNVTDLIFDIEEMIAVLQLWVETESPYFDSASVNRVIDLAAHDLAAMGATIQRLPGRLGYGDILKASIGTESRIGNKVGNQAHDQTGVLICCHADTPHPSGAIDTMAYRREGNKLWGAGIHSSKAGLLVCMQALRQLQQANWQQNSPVTVLVLPDKEQGFESSREFIEASARGCKHVLVMAPGDGGLHTSRHAQARFKLDVKRDRVAELKPLSRSVIAEMAGHVLEIEAMSTPECTYTVQSFESNQWIKFAEKCSAVVLCEAHTPQSVKSGADQMFSLNSPDPDNGLHVNRTVTLPLWEPQAISKGLFDIACDVGGQLNLKLTTSTGAGGSSGNVTGAMGIATLDGLGPKGAGAGTRAEYIEIDSLAERAQLLAGLVSKLA